jgi:hypothetical protein
MVPPAAESPETQIARIEERQKFWIERQRNQEREIEEMGKAIEACTEEIKTATKTFSTTVQAIKDAKPDPQITKGWLVFWGGIIVALIVHAPAIIKAISEWGAAT